MKLKIDHFVRQEKAVEKKAEVVEGELPPAKGDPVTAWSKVEKQISEALAAHKGMDFKIGRTNNPTHRDHAHKAKELIEVYQTKNLDEVKAMEERAIKAFLGRPGCQNKAEDSRGGEGSGSQCVYVAFWDKGKAKTSSI